MVSLPVNRMVTSKGPKTQGLGSESFLKINPAMLVNRMSLKKPPVLKK